MLEGIVYNTGISSPSTCSTRRVFKSGNISLHPMSSGLNSVQIIILLDKKQYTKAEKGNEVYAILMHKKYTIRENK